LAISSDISEKLIYSSLNLLIDMVQDQPKIFAKICKKEIYTEIPGMNPGRRTLLKNIGLLIDFTNPTNRYGNYCEDYPLVYFNLQRLIKTMINQMDIPAIKDILYYLIFQFGDSQQDKYYRTFRENGYSFWKNICYPMRANTNYLKDYDSCKALLDQYRDNNLSGKYYNYYSYSKIIS
jgi:hypothetical protein